MPYQQIEKAKRVKKRNVSHEFKTTGKVKPQPEVLHSQLRNNGNILNSELAKTEQRINLSKDTSVQRFESAGGKAREPYGNALLV